MMIVQCTHCHAYVDAEKKGEFLYGPGEYHDPGRYVFLRCKVCESPILVVQEHTGHSDDEIWTAPTVLYPQSDLRVNPNAPTAIRDAIEEGIKCYRVKAYTAAAIMCRKAIEGICEQHGIKEHNLHSSLKKMLQAGEIDERLYEWSDELRITGNEAAHGVGIISSPQDARDALDFTIAIIDYLFSYRDQFKKFKERRSRKGGASSPAAA